MTKTSHLRGFALSIMIAASAFVSVQQGHAGSQPGIGIVTYNLDEKIADGRATLRKAKMTLAEALAKSKSLLEKAKGTADLAKKLAYLKESVDLLTKAAKLRQQIEQLEASLKAWGIAKEVYENHLAAAAREIKRLQMEQLAADPVQAPDVAAGTPQVAGVSISLELGPTLWVREESFSALSQMDPTNGGLYVSEAWAESEYEGRARWKDACLAAVYAMIEHARGNSSYRIGQDGTWSDLTGAVPIEGTGPEFSSPRDFSKIQAELLAGNPVILRGESDQLGPQHFMLAVGIDAAGQVLALDPWGGQLVAIDSVSWRITHGGAGINYRVIDMRTVDM